MTYPRDNPFHVIWTNGTFFLGCPSLENAEHNARVLNQDAQDNGRSDRFLAIPNPDTPQEES